MPSTALPKSFARSAARSAASRRVAPNANADATATPASPFPRSRDLTASSSWKISSRVATSDCAVSARLASRSPQLRAGVSSSGSRDERLLIGFSGIASSRRNHDAAPPRDAARLERRDADALSRETLLDPLRDLDDAGRVAMDAQRVRADLDT